MTDVTFDYCICWRKWNDAGLPRTMRWCLAAFIMFDASASNDDLDRSEKIVVDIGTCSDRPAAGRHKGRSVIDEGRKRQSKRTNGSATRMSKNARGRPISEDLLKFCSDGEIDYIYDIEMTEIVEQITPLNEGGLRCAALICMGLLFLKKLL
jgi:hypothetical protein